MEETGFQAKAVSSRALWLHSTGNPVYTPGLREVWGDGKTLGAL